MKTNLITIIIIWIILSACATTATTPPATADIATPIIATTLQACMVTAEALNVRTGPGVGYAISGYLAQGDIVTVTVTVDGWHKIPSGWINGRWCK